MSLDFAILGFLNYKPLSGYDLKKIFDDSTHHFWYADQSQIYRTLNRLNEQKLVTHEIIEQEIRPNRKIYHITLSGRDALKKWLVSQPEVDAPHSAPMIQIFFAGQFENDVIIKMFRYMDAILDDLLGRYSEIPEKIEGSRSLVKSDRELYFWKSTLDLNMRIAIAQKDWTKAILADLEAGRIPEN